MFICQFSGKQVAENISPVKVVTHKREKIYTHERRNDRRREGDERPSYRDRDYSAPPATKGWEIVREIMVSPDEVENVKAKFGDGVWVKSEAPIIQTAPERNDFTRRR